MVAVASLSHSIKERLEMGEEVVRIGASLDEYFELLDELEDTPYLVIYEQDEVVATMGEASEMHELLCGNLIYLLNKNYWNTDTRVYGSNCAVYIEACQRGYDPDIVVVKGPSVLYDRPKRVKPILNPRLLVEVLSDSNKGVNFSRKLNCYQLIPSVEQVVLIDQHEPIVNVFERTKQPNEWLERIYNNFEAVVRLDGFEIELKEIYRNVLYFPAKASS